MALGIWGSGMWSYKKAVTPGNASGAVSVEEAVADLVGNVSEQERQQTVSTEFLPKAVKFASSLPFVRDLVAGYYCMSDGKTPVQVKGAILVPLLYFVVPVDAIPDIIPAAGFTDDLGAWLLAAKVFGGYINDEHYKSADELLSPKA